MQLTKTFPAKELSTAVDFRSGGQSEGENEFTTRLTWAQGCWGSDVYPPSWSKNLFEICEIKFLNMCFPLHFNRFNYFYIFRLIYTHEVSGNN